MEILVTFILSVLAGVAANYICKWLDGDDDSTDPPVCPR
ncbi:MAG: nitrate reductase [Clostridia bacterium]|nr:nitrate reductase [Clostridia bacterium]